MFSSVKDKSRKIVTRTIITLNVAALALFGLAYIGAQTGHVHGELEITGWSIGGGTEQHVAREQQLAALSAAIPSIAIAPAGEKASPPPLPARKPAVR